ncbi:MAG: hypothetical protein KDB73_19205 [Planctomycetes bacterium]|nr:hypothetical protein [Planctomycetota bacterium]
MSIVPSCASEKQALEALSDALTGAGIPHSIAVNARGTSRLDIPLPNGDGVIFWDDDEFVFAAGPDGTAFRPMGRSTARLITAVQEVLA